MGTRRTFALMLGVVVVVAALAPSATTADDRSPRVFNGVETPNPGWVTAVLADGSYRCSGTLIHPSWVLTAAHCVTQPSDFAVQVGAAAWADGTYRTVTEVHTHPSWQGDLGAEVDLALLELAAPVTGVTPPVFATDTSLPSLGQRLTVLGWGQTHTNSPPSPTLQGADVVVSSGADGTVDTRWCEPTWVSESDHDYFCFGGGSTAWVCRGDSGGPLTRLAGDHPATLYGVVSFGADVGCSIRETDDVAQRISTHLDWIHATAALPGFVDVHASHVFFTDIEWLADAGITRGCNPPADSRYCPDAPVTRAQMATLLVRALDLQEGPNGGFVDIASGNPHESDISTLAAHGITRGCNPPANDRFCPARGVTRAEMASFLVRAVGLPVVDGPFVDVPAAHPHATDIGSLASAGITRGCNPPANDRFCPGSAVTRAEMAAFLHRAVG